MGTILKVDDINVYYGSIHAIKGISFEVEEGEVVTLIGANGAGKSTTLNTISGLLRSKTGSIEFMGQSLAKVPSHKIVERGLALVPEGRRIFLQMTVQENLEMGAFTQKGGETQQDLEKIYALFPRLKERLKQMAGTLSGGEQQMLAMGRALMSHPKLLMLDERGRPGLCAGDRKDRHHRHRHRAAGQPRHQEGLPGRITGSARGCGTGERSYLYEKTPAPTSRRFFLLEWITSGLPGTCTPADPGFWQSSPSHCRTKPPLSRSGR